jgi:hypothetical protein
MRKPTILLGCDPELFVTTQDGKPRSAHGLIPGTKKEPFKVKKGAIQVDGMALEFNIDPAKTEDQFVGNIKTVLQELRSKVPAEYKFAIKPSVRFHHMIMKKAPDEAKELGCEPDFSAYTMEENPRPDAATTLRTASGHVHIGLEDGADPTSEEHRIKYATLVKHLDLFLGLRSLEWDKDQTRRQLYGNPGACRFKPYGVEYRVLSNQWLDSEKTTRFVYRQTLKAIQHLMNGGKLEDRDYERVKSDIIVGRRVHTGRWPLGLSQKAKDTLKIVNELQI